MPDTSAGGLGRIWLITDEDYYSRVYNATIEISYYEPGVEKESSVRADYYFSTTPTTGASLTDAWLQQFFARRNERLERQITAIEGIHDTVAHLHAHCQGRIAVASGADRFKVEMMLRKVGLHSFFEGRIFSGHEMPRS